MPHNIFQFAFSHLAVLFYFYFFLSALDTIVCIEKAVQNEAEEMHRHHKNAVSQWNLKIIRHNTEVDLQFLYRFVFVVSEMRSTA